MAALSAKCYSPQPATPTPCFHVPVSSGGAFQHAEELSPPPGQDHAVLCHCWTVPSEYKRKKGVYSGDGDTRLLWERGKKRPEQFATRARLSDRGAASGPISAVDALTQTGKLTAPNAN
ncbi:unnamed protein product [Pleuronectes platessa]|uniref:Uncharacterized protein n=1 Tax=Pleuronectes platessa TaxID=8262 RepID=A0A9N7TNX5_PLEPL|nr:unnamed protein product [Pleuronectes platessa]